MAHQLSSGPGGSDEDEDDFEQYFKRAGIALEDDEPSPARDHTQMQLAAGETDLAATQRARAPFFAADGSMTATSGSSHGLMHVTAGTGTGSSSSNQAASRTSVRFSTPSLHSSSPLAPASPRTPASTVRPAAVPPARPAPFFASSFSPRSPQLTLNMVSNDQLAPQGRSYDSPGATVSSQQRRGLLTRAAPPPTTSTSSQYAYWQDQGDMYGYEEQGGAHSYDWQQYIEDDGADQHDGVGGGRGDASQAMVPPSSVSSHLMPVERHSAQPPRRMLHHQQQQHQQQQAASSSQPLLLSDQPSSSRNPAPPSQPQKRSAPTLKPVSVLPEEYRTLFKFGVLNAVQSACFHSVYETDDNVVVSAPTGAGKTVLFDLAIIRAFSRTHAPAQGGSSGARAKVVYIAPTKSLCAERARDWEQRFKSTPACADWHVVELTGDSSLGSLKDVANARLIVTTPEKWDSLTRRWHENHKLLAKLALLCIDECHAVGYDSRGGTLEAVVSRVKTLGNYTRLIALSATVPNIDDVATWIRRSKYSEEKALVHSFGEEYRPCKLTRVVREFGRTGNDFQFFNTIKPHLIDIILEFGSGKPVLVFCSTRKSCMQAAEQLAKDYEKLLSSSRSAGALPWRKPPASAARKFRDPKLASVAKFGVAFHSAGVEFSDRHEIERSFLSQSGGISVICATSTLAVGVNLPAHLVVIAGTTQWTPEHGSLEYSELDVLQMIGRAGRPQFDTFGVAVIMTDSSHSRHYERMLYSQNMLESGLHRNLIQHINSEITLNTITDIDSALAWLRSTFLYVRIGKNVHHYAIEGMAATSSNPEERLEQICVETVERLVGDGMVERRGTAFVSTDLGECMSKWYISHTTLLAFNGIPPKANMRTLLEVASAATEFETVKFRQGEKGAMQKIAKRLKYPLQKVGGSADKVFCLVQMTLEGIPFAELAAVETVNPASDVAAIWQQLPRFAHCLIDLAAVDKDAIKLRNALELCRSIYARAWDRTSTSLRQIGGIGEKSVKLLEAQNIFSLRDVVKADPRKLELALNRNPPYGNQLIAQADAFPRFSISIESLSETAIESGIEVEVGITVALENAESKPKLRDATCSHRAVVLVMTNDGEWIDCQRVAAHKLQKQPASLETSFTFTKPSQRMIALVSPEHVAGLEMRAELKPKTASYKFPVPAVKTMPVDADEVADDDDKQLKLTNSRFKSVKPTISKPVKTSVVTAEPTGKSALEGPTKPAFRPASALMREEEAGAAPASLDLPSDDELPDLELAHAPGRKKAKRQRDASEDEHGRGDAKVRRVESQGESDKLRRRADGKWDCNHTCADKTKCRHLCCREGLEKVPRKRKAVSAARAPPRTTSTESVETKGKFKKDDQARRPMPLFHEPSDDELSPPPRRKQPRTVDVPASAAPKFGRFRFMSSGSQTKARKAEEEIDELESDVSVPSSPSPRKASVDRMPSLLKLHDDDEDMEDFALLHESLSLSPSPEPAPAPRPCVKAQPFGKTKVMRARTTSSTSEAASRRASLASKRQTSENEPAEPSRRQSPPEPEHDSQPTPSVSVAEHDPTEAVDDFERYLTTAFEIVDD